MTLTLEIKECGKVTIQWKKSCGDFSIPPKGLSVDLQVPNEISSQLADPTLNIESEEDQKSKSDKTTE
jgi:hypothetical protein